MDKKIVNIENIGNSVFNYKTWLIDSPFIWIKKLLNFKHCQFNISIQRDKSIRLFYGVKY